MGIVTVLPSGITIDAAKGSSIMEAAWARGLYWPTTCGGQGICTSCVCVVEEGEASLDEMGRGERKRLIEEFGEPNVNQRRLRLACQARVRGDVTVRKSGVRADGDVPSL